ncbi:MAG: VOC family protein, partial [Luminiphilus sp.]|nr:VOC family protein [Luminiphilus sp.]
ALQSLATRAIFRLLSMTGLLALRRLAKQDFSNRLFRWFGGPQGFSDICFRVIDLDAFQDRCAQMRLPLTASLEFCRQRPDGIDVRWRLAGAIDDSQAFFIEDITPIQCRIPEGKSREHANGAIGITRVTSRVSLEQRPTDVEFRTAPDLGGQRFTITLRTNAIDKSLLKPLMCCGALIEFE